MPEPNKDFTTSIWHHTCFTWSRWITSNQLKELYLNGNKIAEKEVPTQSKVPINGTLVLGQDYLGGGFDVRQSFAGEIYQLEIFKTKLSADEVTEMYQAGMCDYPAPSADVLLDWEYFLNAERSGEVKEISAGCPLDKSDWSLLENFVGQEITPNLIAFLNKYF